MDFLPQMGSEDLNQGNLERRDLSVHEHSREIELDLETDVNIGSVDGRGPPHGETSIGDLRKTRSLSVGKLFKFH